MKNIMIFKRAKRLISTLLAYLEMTFLTKSGQHKNKKVLMLLTWTCLATSHTWVAKDKIRAVIMEVEEG